METSRLSRTIRFLVAGLIFCNWPTSALSIEVGTSEAPLSKFYLKTEGNGYHGLIAEDSLVVNVTPSIVAIGEMVCGFSILHHHHHHGELPFDIVILDQEAGTGELRVKRALDCEEKTSYQFDIQAVSCSGTYSDSVGVHVMVQDVNEYAPEWTTVDDENDDDDDDDDDEDDDGNGDNPSPATKSVTIEEGQILEQVVRVEAVDRDCSPKFGDICDYQIESQGQPFAISKEGVIRNTMVLNYSVSHSYILSVVAFDCGQRRSEPLLVTVEVRQACNTGWTGLTPRVNYIPGTGPQALFNDATLDVCPQSSCETSSMEATITLEANHIGKGCDRDTYSLASQRQLCGASERAVDLLPDSQLPGAEWTENLIRDKGRSADSSMVLFDGRTGLNVPEAVLNSREFPASKFTVSTWMRHRPREDADKHRKEHIICKADDHRKNRHHFSIFVRNCKLVMLLRREFQEGEENVFRPAEWRWKLPQVCDDEWHHYAINVNFPDVELIVDGDKWIDERENPEIIDDWPLHPAGDINTKLTIGACWQGSESDFRHELKGYLAGLSYLAGSNEHAEVLRCLHQCAESLQVPASTDALAPGMEMVVDAKGSRVVINGNKAENISSLVRQVAYLNTREFPAPGRRLVHLTTTLHCLSGKTIHLEDDGLDVNVVPVPEPTIEITGTQNIARDYEDFKLGVRIFADVHIVMTTGSSAGAGEPVNGIENRLDHCSVSVSPSLNPDHEAIEVPDDLLRSLSIVGAVSADGADFAGAEMIYNYERLLRQVTYTNKKPAYYLNRQFKISCSELNGRFVSNEYSQTLTVIHPSMPDAVKEIDIEISKADVHHAAKDSHRQLDVHSVEQGTNDLYDLMTDRLLGGASPQAHSNVTALVVVVCCVLLLAVLIVAVVRVRASHRRAAKDELQAEVEMAWDDSALNITVNPMEETDMGAGGSGAKSVSIGHVGTSTVDDDFDEDYDEDEDDSGDSDGFDDDEESGSDEDDDDCDAGCHGNSSTAVATYHHHHDVEVGASQLYGEHDSDNEDAEAHTDARHRLEWDHNI